MRIAVFGGSFNPIHTGHAVMAQEVMRSGDVDQVWLMVSPQNPWKEERGLMPEEERLRLVRLVAEDIPGVEASDFEFRLPRPSYTYATLRALREKWPEHEFILLIGSDNWNAFSKWRNWKEILSGFEVLIYQRPDCPVSGDLPQNVKLLKDVPLMLVSSTYIRELMAKGESIRYLVPDKVARCLGYKQ